jgi:hypothetical protein
LWLARGDDEDAPPPADAAPSTWAMCRRVKQNTSD